MNKMQKRNNFTTTRLPNAQKQRQRSIFANLPGNKRFLYFIIFHFIIRFRAQEVRRKTSYTRLLLCSCLRILCIPTFARRRIKIMSCVQHKREKTPLFYYLFIYKFNLNREYVYPAIKNDKIIYVIHASSEKFHGFFISPTKCRREIEQLLCSCAKGALIARIFVFIFFHMLLYFVYNYLGFFCK